MPALTVKKIAFRKLSIAAVAIVALTVSTAVYAWWPTPPCPLVVCWW